MNPDDTVAKIIGVLLVDDHPVVRDGYRHLLESTPDIRVIGEAGDGEIACKLYVECSPDVVILDLSMPGMGGLEAIRRIKARDGQAHILVFSMQDSETLIMRALAAGATGYLSKHGGAGQMVGAGRQGAQGGPFIAAEDVSKHSYHQVFPTEEDPMHALSSREFQVFQLPAEGRSTVDIAAALSISPKTVGVHHANIMKKLNLQNNSQLVRLAIRSNVIQA
jgi:two-component system, NarL family, invasion response regulator UvrY